MDAKRKLDIAEFFEFYKSTMTALLQPLLLLSLLFCAPGIVSYGVDNTIGAFIPALSGFVSFILWIVGLCVNALAPLVFMVMIIQYYRGEKIEIQEFLKGFDTTLLWPSLVVISFQHLIAAAPAILIAFTLPLGVVIPPYFFVVALLSIPAVLIAIACSYAFAFTPQMYYFNRTMSLEPLILAFNFFKKNFLVILLFFIGNWALMTGLSMVFGSISMMSSLASFLTSTSFSSFDVNSLQNLSTSEVQSQLMGISTLFRANLIDQILGVIQVCLTHSLASVFFLYVIGFLHAPHEFKLNISNKLS
ncbi:MAG: hypothetical protein KC646_03425 [Candidatus Cloacimonetes bacterium]|nr:hypothetical protein [Candidatus Cloacimonadota bacterium]